MLQIQLHQLILHSEDLDDARPISTNDAASEGYVDTSQGGNAVLVAFE